MWALLIRIAEGVVVGGRSKVVLSRQLPDACCEAVIEGCLERDPAQRFPSVQAVVQELRGMLRELPDETRRESTQAHADEPPTTSKAQRDLGGDREHAAIRAITEEVVEAAELAVWEWSYSVERSLGRVRGHPIFLATPRADLIAVGPVPRREHVPQARHGDRPDEGRRTRARSSRTGSGTSGRS